MQTLYDPTCGSGSLLLKAADDAPYGITIYGQEMDLSTYALARMNMILHDQFLPKPGQTASMLKMIRTDVSTVMARPRTRTAIMLSCCIWCVH